MDQITNKQLRVNQIPFTYLINKEEKTAKIIGTDHANGDIIIPRSINYEGQDFIISSIREQSFSYCLKISSIQFSPDSEVRQIEKKLFTGSSIKKVFIPNKVIQICEGAFANCSKLSQIEIPPDSKLMIIEKSAFYCSNIESLTIPASVCELKEGWCVGTRKLTKVTISPNNQHYKNYGQFVIGKSDSQSEEFDVLIFANRDVKTVEIPLFLKQIEPYSFSNSSLENIKISHHITHIGNGAFFSCNQLKIVDIPQNSNLKEIGQYAFAFTSIESMFIPSHVKKLEESIFSCCNNLHQVDISADSEMRSIETNAFFFSSVERLSIPSSVCELKPGWCSGTSKLTKVTINPNNDHYKNYENLIIGKSDNKSDEFDVLVFADRDIKRVEIPPFIKQIASFAFSESKIEKVIIPHQITLIGEKSFHYCQMLKRLEIPNESKLQIIDNKAFSESSIECIYIPRHIRAICEYAFCYCYHLKILEFDENIEMINIPIDGFNFGNKTIIMIPIKLRGKLI